MPKLVFFDIDGTLVSYEDTEARIPEATLEAIKLLKASGCTLSLATARSYAMTYNLMRKLDINNAVLCNGAHIVIGGKTINKIWVDKAVVNEIKTGVSEWDCEIYASDERFIYLKNTSQESLAYITAQAGGQHFVKDFDMLKNACIMNLYGKSCLDSDICNKASIKTAAQSVEILPSGVAKHAGVCAIAGYLGFSIRDTIAVGDSENDIDMLKTAGIGIAVGNAGETVKRQANIISDKIENGGILKVFHKLNLI